MNPVGTPELNTMLVDKLKASGALRSPSIEAAFRAVQRHHFLPGVSVEDVYRDEAIATKRRDGIRISSSSQPSIMAAMLEQLAPERGQRVLEIGAGTGYNAALLAHLVGQSGTVVSVDIDVDIVEAARQHLRDAGFERVLVVCGDGGLGYAEQAPYDAIILTVGTWDVAPAWWEQLRPGGRIVMPLTLRGPETQHAIAFERGDNRLTSISVHSCGFMLMRGAFAGPIQQLALGQPPGLWLVHDHAGTVNPQVVLGWADQPSGRVLSGIRANSRAIASGLNPWLGLHDDRFVAVKAEGAGLTSAFAAAAVYGFGDHPRTAVGLLGTAGLSLVGRAVTISETSGADEWAADAPLAELEVRSFGEGTQLANRLLELLQSWDSARRPDADRLHVVAYPEHVDVALPSGAILVTKRWSQLVLQWD